MAAFFPRTVYNTEASFTPLFRLLDDFDSYSRQCSSASNNNNNNSSSSLCAAKKQKPQQLRKSTIAHWQPRFDVRETADAYELHGELPGVDKRDVSIEFTEPQTLVVRGKTERTYTTGSAAAAAVPRDSAPAAVEEAAAPQQSPEEPAASASSSSHQATVADEDDASVQEESGFDVVSEASDAAAPATPETTEAAAVAAAPAAPVDNSKYWLRERSIGEFARSFNFPSRVDQGAVTAGFQDGILSISVPKAKKHEAIRIAIN